MTIYKVHFVPKSQTFYVDDSITLIVTVNVCHVDHLAYIGVHATVVLKELNCHLHRLLS